MAKEDPEWLTLDFLNQCLHSKEQYKHIIATSFRTSPAVPPGNNYGSCIIRVTLDYKDEDTMSSLSLIVKYDDGPLKGLIDNFFECEPLFYNKFLPLAAQLLNHSFAPTNFIAPISSVMVMEDLKELGYKMADRTKHLDLEHCKLYITAAATFHALSFAIHKKEPEFIESLGSEKLYSNELKHAQSQKVMLKTNFECLVKHLSKLQDYSKYVDIVKRSSCFLWDMLIEAHKRCDTFNALHQGDPWITNMMFKYDQDGNVTSVKLLDFQALRYGSPVNDLVFFIWSSARHDVRKLYLDELYQMYFDTLNSTLKKLNCTEQMPLETFQRKIKELSPLALWIGTFPTMYDPTPIDFQALLSEPKEGVENPFERFYNENFCNTHIPRIFDALELAGVFEYMSTKIDCGN